MKWLVLKFVEHGLLAAMFVGAAAMIGIGLVSEDMGHRLAFLLLGSIGAGAGLAALWLRRAIQPRQNHPEGRGRT